MTKMFPLILPLLLSLSTTSAAPKCDSNSICLSPDPTTSITVSCRKEENLINLKWKTPRTSSSVLLHNGNVTFEFTCDPSRDNLRRGPEVKQKQFKMSKGEVSCEVEFYRNSSINQNHLSYLSFDTSNSDPFLFDTICNPKIEGFSREFKQLLVKTHAILMLIGWLFFVPTGFLFARFGKEVFKGKTLIGLPVWFQVHRTSTFIGVSCVCVSMLCILFSTEWTWKGTGSGAWYWTQWHTDLGTISTILAVSQPLNSLLRCSPVDSNRYIFNWAHRVVGIAAYSFAVAAIYVAAANYRKTWSEPFMEIALVTVPTILCLAGSILVPYLESRNKKEYERVEMIERVNVSKAEGAQSPRAPLQLCFIFLVVGVCFGVATSLCLLVANGFKNG